MDVVQTQKRGSLSSGLVVARTGVTLVPLPYPQGADKCPRQRLRVRYGQALRRWPLRLAQENALRVSYLLRSHNPARHVPVTKTTTASLLCGLR
jgi:hypothetical protein